MSDRTGRVVLSLDPTAERRRLTLDEHARIGKMLDMQQREIEAEFVRRYGRALYLQGMAEADRFERRWEPLRERLRKHDICERDVFEITGAPPLYVGGLPEYDRSKPVRLRRLAAELVERRHIGAALREALRGHGRLGTPEASAEVRAIRDALAAVEARCAAIVAELGTGTVRPVDLKPENARRRMRDCLGPIPAALFDLIAGKLRGPGRTFNREAAALTADALNALFDLSIPLNEDDVKSRVQARLPARSVRRTRRPART